MIQDIYPHQYHVEYKEKEPASGDFVFSFQGDCLLASVEDGTLSFPTWEDIDCDKGDVQFLFSIDDKNYFMLWDSLQPVGAFSYQEPKTFRTAEPMWKSFAAITGIQIHRWYQNHRYCSCCGNRLRKSSEERALICQECGKTIYPVISPSVIVAVTNGDKILLTKYNASHSSYQRYALVAGYAEVGETLEDTVRREVMEEVGLKVKNIKYYKSQPWSFTDTLLVGYTCEVDGDDTITREEAELSYAGWFTREENPVNPSKISLTNEMIENFRMSRNIAIYEKSN